MPRAKKTPMGAPAQPVRAITGQTYGEGVQQEALQRTMPAPAAPLVQTPVPTSQANNNAESTNAPQQPQASMADVISRIAGSGGLLKQPDQNPTIPVTQGLPVGPGRGPQMNPMNNPLGDTLRRLARETGDNVFIELASKAQI
jgi:hypothetical protein